MKKKNVIQIQRKTIFDSNTSLSYLLEGKSGIAPCDRKCHHMLHEASITKGPVPFMAFPSLSSHLVKVSLLIHHVDSKCEHMEAIATPPSLQKEREGQKQVSLFICRETKAGKYSHSGYIYCVLQTLCSYQKSALLDTNIATREVLLYSILFLPVVLGY